MQTQTDRTRDWSSFCVPWEERIRELDVAMANLRGATTMAAREKFVAAIHRCLHRKMLARPEAIRRGTPGPDCVRRYHDKRVEAVALLRRTAPTAEVSLSGLGDCQNYVHAHKAPTNVGVNAHTAGYGPCGDSPPPAVRSKRCGPGYNFLFGRCVPMIPLSGVHGLGDAVPQTMGPETARALARALMTSSKVAPDLYNPASALDQVLEGVQPGLSPKVTMRARVMIASGVHPQNALEQALAEELVALAPKYAAPKYPKYPKQPALSGCACHERDGLGDLGTCGSGTAGLVCVIMEGTGALLAGVNTLATGITSETRARDQQRFDQRMTEANAERRAVEDAALREAGSLSPLAPAGGGIGMGTILLGVLGLAAAGGAVYFLTKK